MTIQYDPQKVTDWLTPLEKVYARQSQQLDRYHNQLRERDRQEQEATLNVPEMFSKLASFSKTIGSVVEARKKEQREQDWSNVKNVFNTASSIEELRKINQDYALNKGELLENWEGYEKLINKSTKLSREQKSYALEQSPRRQLRIKEVLGQSIASNLEPMWQEHLKSGEAQAEYAQYDAIGKNAYREEWAKKTLSKYGYKDGFILENVKPELNRFLDTENTITKIKAKNIKFSNDESLFETAGDQLNLTGTPEQRGEHHLKYIEKHAVLSSDPDAYETEIQQGVQKWKITQNRIFEKGEDSLGDLEKILNSKVKHRGSVTKENPEGWTTFEKAFLTDEDVAE